MLAVGMFLVDRYEILAKIGTGGMADVYKAKDHILGRVVAVKVLKQELSEDINFVTKFRTEAQSAAGLEHPNIVNIYDVGSENGLHFIVMEHIEGITLKTYIEKKGQLSFKEATSIAIQVARGIETAHNKEITHRDIKPQNIIISTEGKVKVTDFGIARASNSNTISADVMGSVHYASPEQARNGYVDGRSDIYSLGIVMYEMVTGRVPFDGDSTVAVALQHLQEEMVGPSVYAQDLPISYEKIVLKCTQKNPDRRYQSVAELLADLRKALVSPDEDFVVIAPLAAAAKTRIIGSAELEIIKDGAKAADLKKENDFVKEDEEYGDDELEIDDEVDDIEEDAGFLNPTVEKVITGVGIFVLVLIIVLSIVMVTQLFKILNNGERPGGQSTQTESQTESETDSDTQDNSKFEMIDLIGKTVDEAIDELDKLGLELNIVTYQQSNKKDGTILGQDPEEGTKVKKGDVIDVIVAGDDSVVQKVSVPNVVDKSESEAVSLLKNSGLNAKKQYKYSDEVKKGYVISQTPEGGESVKKNTYITIVISNGPEKATVPALEDMVNLNFAEVEGALKELGFVVNKVEAYNDDVEAGLVYDVTHAGEEVAYGSTIDVHVSLGEEPTYIYQVSYDFAAEAPEDAVKYDYVLTITGNGTEKKYGYGETAFDVITYTSNTEMTSVSIYVTWYNENGQKIREKDTTLTVNKLVLGEGESFDGDEITHSPSQSGGPSDEGGADQDTTPLDPVEPTHEEQQ